METSKRKSFDDLSGSGDPQKIIFCLKLLCQESFDDDFKDAAITALTGIASLKQKILEPAKDSISSALNELRVKIGNSKYIQLIARMPAKVAQLCPLFLSSIDPNSNDFDYQALSQVAGWPDLPDSTANWLARCSTDAPTEIALSLLTPFLQHVCEKMDVFDPIDADFELVMSLCQRLPFENYLTNTDSLSSKVIAGIILCLGLQRQPRHVSLIGPFIENIGVMDNFSGVLLKPERINELFHKANEVGLASSLTRIMNECSSTGANLAEQIAQDRQFRRDFAKLLSSGSSFGSVCRVLVDPGLVKTMKELVSDSDLPCRRAAVISLERIGSHDAIPFLKTGLIDSNKDVRQLSANALRSMLGDEQFKKTVEEMKIEASSIIDKFKELEHWVQGMFSAAKSTLSAPVELFGEAGNWIEKQTKGILGKFRRD